EAIKLAFDETGQVVLEQATAAGTHESFATAEPLGVLPKLHVPNTLQPGDHYYGQSFDVSALAVTGDIRLPGARRENHVYSFQGHAGDLMNFEIYSGALEPLRGNPIDSVLRLFDANGNQIAINDDGLESTDSDLLDVVLPANGIYYIMVDTFAAQFDVDVGTYELFMSQFALGASSGAGDTLIGGAGNDVAIGSAADDYFRADGSTAADFDSFAGKNGFDVLDLTSYPALNYTASSIELIKNSDQAPMLA